MLVTKRGSRGRSRGTIRGWNSWMRMDKIHTLVFVTGNELKFQVAAQALQGSGISLEQKSLPVPEIQSRHLEEIASWSADWACRQLSQSVVVTDAGFSIEALNGFPGPFIKFVNEWFSAEDYLSLMRDKPNRRVIAQDCLAYCQPGEKPIVFNKFYSGEMATKPGRQNGTPMDQLFIPEGYSLPISDIPVDEMVAYWSNATTWHELRRYLASLT